MTQVRQADFDHRLEGETSKAFRAFVLYRDLGPERTIDAAFALGGGRASGGWKHWSSRHAWVARAGAFDDAVAAKKLNAAFQRLERGFERIEREA